MKWVEEKKDEGGNEIIHSSPSSKGVDILLFNIIIIIGKINDQLR